MVLIWTYTFYAKYVHQNVYQMKRKYLNQRQIVNLPEGAHCDIMLVILSDCLVTNNENSMLSAAWF